MKVLQINAVPYGSTGRIMFQLADGVRDAGGGSLCTAGFTWQTCTRPDFFLTSGILEKTAHTWLARLTGRNGMFSAGATRRLIRRIEKFDPDVIHLHNLHCWFVNLPMLFSYLKERGTPVVWTLHDCWAFTGHCPHFDGVGCEKWKTECGSCPLYRHYPQCFLDDSRMMHRRKKAWFSGLDNLTIVTPSRWLADRVRESFLGAYPVEVIPNGIDLGAFSPRQQSVKARLGIENKHMLLGVSYAWDDKKGLDVFQKLRQQLDEDYAIVLVGVEEALAQRLPEGIIPIRRTESREELAELYSAADLFANPTREDNFPTVNLEALACGTPVVTFDTGGSPEALDASCGSVVPRGDTAALEARIRQICSGKPYSSEDCRRRGAQFGQDAAVSRYLDLYRSKL